MLQALTRGRLLDPAQGIDREGTLIIENGLIKDLTFSPPPDEADVIDVSGHLVVPGFIDLSCRPGSVSSSSLASLGQAAASGGFTGVTVLPDTTPPLTDELRLAGLKALAQQHCPVRLYPLGAMSRNLEGKELADMGSLAHAGAYGFSDGTRWPANSQLLFLALKYVSIFERPLFIHPEDPALAAGGLMRESLAATRLGLPAIPAVAEEAAVARDLLLTQASGGQLHFIHLSTAKAVALLSQVRQQGTAATGAVPVSHLLLTCDDIKDYNTSLKLTPPLGERKDREALIQAVKTGTLAAIVTDHTPASPEQKDVEFAAAAWGGSFLRHAFPLLYTKLVRPGKLDLATVITRLTTGPAQILGLDQAGTLKPGSPADITVINLEATAAIGAHELPSSERNTPFLGEEVSGLPMLTLVNGNVVFKIK
ncbi:MAG TPA: dihydroorotase [Firmicutes bacterium]|jgi:dihydroorotase|nr:dihydroorotase [Bacillota bacterium]